MKGIKATDKSEVFPANKPGSPPYTQNEVPELVYSPYVELVTWPVSALSVLI
jgi:hypothetical protein